MSFFTELKRRNVFKVGIAYAIVAWLLIQVTSTVAPALHLPDWTLTFIVYLLIIGFPFALILAWIYELTPEGIKVTTSEGPAQFHTQTTGQRLNYFIIGVLILVVAFLLVKDYLPKESQEVKRITPGTSIVKESSSPSKGVEEKARPSVPSNSIAVLPFTDMSPDKDQDYFADGIAEEILNSLARIKDLEVRGRTSSFYFKGKNEDLHTISKMLNVKYILEGSVRKAGNQVRITVQMINTLSNEHLWSKTYDRTLDDIFAIQEDIAKSIADTLQITLGVGELGREPGMTRNVEAFNAFLDGRSLFNTPNQENLAKAIEQLEHAVTLDPDFAIGWETLANAYGLASTGWIPERTQEYIAKRDAARSRIVELFPESDSALRIKAEESATLVETEQLIKQALSLNPANYNINYEYANILITVGQLSDAIDYFQRAIRIEPLASQPHLILGITYELNGNRTAAAEEINKARQLSNEGEISTFCLLVLALEADNHSQIEEYVPLVVKSNLLGNINKMETRDINEVMYSLINAPEKARTELKQFFIDPAYTNPIAQEIIAVWASYFGEQELALEAFKKANASNTLIIFLIWRPIHQPMRRLPGFKDFVKKLGLVDYWRTTRNWGDFCHPVGKDDFECK